MVLSDKQLWDRFSGLAQKRDHVLKKIDYAGARNSKLYLFCNKCKLDFAAFAYSYVRETSSTNYKKDSGKPPPPCGYCCPGCKSNNKKLINFPSGPDHHNWKGGISQTEEKREGHNEEKYASWRRGAFTIYKGLCFLTQSADRLKLRVHHLNSWYVAPGQRYDLRNAVLIHEDVHVKFHQIYGDNTTVKQFEEFAEQFYNITVFPWNEPNPKDQQSIPSDDPKNAYHSTVKAFSEETDALLAIFEAEKDVQHRRIVSLATDRGYQVVEGSYDNKNSKYSIYCPKHEETHVVKFSNFMRSEKFGIPCCRAVSPNLKPPPSQKGAVRTPEMIARNLESQRRRCELKFDKFLKDKNYILLSGKYENKFTEFEIKCLKHNSTEKVKYDNLMKRKNKNLKCCQDDTSV